MERFKEEYQEHKFEHISLRYSLDIPSGDSQWAVGYESGVWEEGSR